MVGASTLSGKVLDTESTKVAPFTAKSLPFAVVNLFAMNNYDVI